MSDQLTLWMFFRYVTQTWDYFKKMGVPYAPPLPFVGNVIPILTKVCSHGSEISWYIYNSFVGSSVSYGGSMGEWMYSLSVLSVAPVQFPATAENFKGLPPGGSHSANPTWAGVAENGSIPT